ncbi:MAG: M28 family metallopeptidase [Phycisphaerales bacterium JB061]
MYAPKIPAARPITASLTLAASLMLFAGCSSSGRATTVTKAPEVVAPERYAVLDGQKVDVPSMKLGDEATIQAILREGKRNNKVMDHLRHLALEIGPRLTASSALEEANMWSAAQYENWGLSNVENRQWGTATVRFDRGPSSGAVVSVNDDGETRTEREIEFTTLSFAAGTDGPVRGHVVRMPTTLEELEAVRDKLDGAWVLHSRYQGGRAGIRGVGGQMVARHNLRLEARKALDAGERIEIPTSATYPNDPISGLWKGTITGPAIPTETTDMMLDVTLDETGTPTGEVSLPAFGFVNEMVEPSFADGILVFTWNTPEGPRPMQLTPRGDEIEWVLGEGDDAYTIKLTREAPTEFDASEYIMQEVLATNPAGFLSSSRDERVWTTAIKRGMALFGMDIADVGQDPEVSIRDSDYRYINSELADGQEVLVEFDLEHNITEGPFPMYNTIAEIPGNVWPDEVVIVSAHLDSWNGPGSQGVVDNGTGSAVTLEAARILAAVGAKPKRTIRFILWTGEEQGLLGSRAYVESLSEEERAKISAVFVDDGGTNYEGGLVCPPWMFEYLAPATAATNGQFFSEIDEERLLNDDDPNNDDRAGWMDVNLRSVDNMPQGGGSDHASFNAVGIPGFYWDEIGRANYRYGWHTQNDRIDLAIEEYLVQSSTNAALTAYNLACAPSLLPREPKVAENTPANTGTGE